MSTRAGSQPLRLRHAITTSTTASPDLRQQHAAVPAGVQLVQHADHYDGTRHAADQQCRYAQARPEAVDSVNCTAVWIGRRVTGTAVARAAAMS